MPSLRILTLFETLSEGTEPTEEHPRQVHPPHGKKGSTDLRKGQRDCASHSHDYHDSCVPLTTADSQPPAYHLFADHRRFLGIPIFGGVISNLPFAVIGIWGVMFLLRSGSDEVNSHFLDQRERGPYPFVFVGLLLTAFGSSYYHLCRDNARLVWDRLPMTIALMSMVAAIIAERIRVRMGLWLLPIPLLIGVGSVVQCYLSEVRFALLCRCANVFGTRAATGVNLSATLHKGI